MFPKVLACLRKPMVLETLAVTFFSSAPFTIKVFFYFTVKDSFPSICEIHFFKLTRAVLMAGFDINSLFSTVVVADCATL